MPDDMDRLNDRLFRAKDDDVFFFFYPPEGAITKHDLMTRLNPAPLPDAPPDPDPLPVPDPETLVVHSSAGLSVRAGPSVTAKKIAVLSDGDTVDVVGSTIGGDYHWAQLIRVNGLKFAETGFVAREYLSPKAQVPA